LEGALTRLRASTDLSKTGRVVSELEDGVRLVPYNEASFFKMHKTLQLQDQQEVDSRSSSGAVYSLLSISPSNTNTTSNATDGGTPSGPSLSLPLELTTLQPDSPLFDRCLYAECGTASKVSSTTALLLNAVRKMANACVEMGRQAEVVEQVMKRSKKSQQGPSSSSAATAGGGGGTGSENNNDNDGDYDGGDLNEESFGGGHMERELSRVVELVGAVVGSSGKRAHTLASALVKEVIMFGKE
jgi:hypothetical protein